MTLDGIIIEAGPLRPKREVLPKKGVYADCAEQRNYGTSYASWDNSLDEGDSL